MGVDFSLEVVRKVGNKWVRVRGEGVPEGVLLPYSYVDPPFSKRARRTISKLIGQRLSFDFYDITNNGSFGGEGEDIHFDPRQVCETLQTLKNVMSEHQRKLPHFYWFYVPGGVPRWTSGARVFIDGVRTGLWGHWDSCLMVTGFGPGKRLKKKDISEVRRISCNQLIDREKNGKWVEVEGRKIVVRVQKQSMYDYWRGVLNGMINICTYADKKGYYVQGVVS